MTFARAARIRAAYHGKEAAFKETTCKLRASWWTACTAGKPADRVTRVWTAYRNTPATTTTACSAHRCLLVGAGPGDGDLLTLRAVQALAAADCVIYDDLAAESCLQHCNANVQRIYVGKRGGQRSIKQAEINELLVDQCAKHAQVVRLKGGCATIFGRASSEILTLREAGVHVEIVPGVTSMCAAAAAGGIPLTSGPVSAESFQSLGGDLRADSVLVMSAHNSSKIAWDKYGPDAVDTIVLYMGASQVAICKNAGTTDSHFWAFKLDTVAVGADALSALHGGLSPCIIVVGSVVRLAAVGLSDPNTM